MNNKKMFIIYLFIVLLLGFMISAGTFAYFQWTTDDTQRTNVNVTIAAGGIKMTITQENGKLETAGLRPVADCTKSYSYIDALVEIENTTGTLTVPSFKLKGKVTSSGTLSSSDLSHIHYSVVNLGPVTSTNYTTFADSAASCDEPATVSSGGIFANNYSLTATGTFGNVSTAGEWTDMPSTNYLARFYQSGSSSGITFIGNRTGEGYLKNGRNDFTWNVFRVYVWIDENYTYTVVGNQISDPLQDATVWLQWSENSIVEQVSGNSDTILATGDAGLYGTDGSFTSWDELVDNGDITLSSGTVITASNVDLTGSLVIPEGITEIGDYAFVGASDKTKMPTKLNSITIPASVIKIGVHAFTGCEQLNTVTFAPNSQLTTIGEYAFLSSNLTSIEIPASVTSIGGGAFSNCEQLNTVTFAPNSQLATIGEFVFSKSNLNSIEIPASVTSIVSSSFSNCEQLNTVTFAPNSQLATIGFYAFEGSNLTSIEIPASVTSIGQGAFADCEQLNTITYSGTCSQWIAIDKYNSNFNSWNTNVPATYVQCLDGTVAL